MPTLGLFGLRSVPALGLFGGTESEQQGGARSKPHLHASCAVSAWGAVSTGVTLGGEEEKLAPWDEHRVAFRGKKCWWKGARELQELSYAWDAQRCPVQPWLEAPIRFPRVFFPKGGFAYLAPRLASRTCETGGTHGAGGASVARRAGCSLLSGFALNEGEKSV